MFLGRFFIYLLFIYILYIFALLFFEKYMLGCCKGSQDRLKICWSLWPCEFESRPEYMKKL